MTTWSDAERKRVVELVHFFEERAGFTQTDSQRFSVAALRACLARAEDADRLEAKCAFLPSWPTVVKDAAETVRAAARGDRTLTGDDLHRIADILEDAAE